MNNKIDIVLPWLNGNDEHWLSEYSKYIKTVKPGDKSISRFRDWDTLRYLLRSIEKNANWVNKVVLCVFDEYQIPNWLNINNNRLKIVYHKDYIPNSCIPTFNGLCSSAFLFGNDCLENNIISCNDDYIFVNKCKETDFFINDKCVKYYEELPNAYNFYHQRCKDVWCGIMANTIEYKAKITGSWKNYYTRHVPCSFHKADFLEFYKNNYTVLKKEFSKYESKIRQITNLLPEYIVDWIQGDKQDYIQDKDFYNNYKVIDLYKHTNYQDIMNACLTKKCICLNDQSSMMNEAEFHDMKNKVIRILSAIFPNKCSFEV
jgi:hypothetical protein